MPDTQKLIKEIRATCIKAALDAYEEGGVLGLCAEGRWEYAISALQQVDLTALIAQFDTSTTRSALPNQT